MRLAAGGAPVAVKRRTVEPVNKVKILPVEPRENEMFKIYLLRYVSIIPLCEERLAECDTLKRRL
jgi:hypothetical protein